MRDIILFISIAVFMAFGFIAVGKAEDFFSVNYRGFEQDECHREDTSKNNENKYKCCDKPKNKV